MTQGKIERYHGERLCGGAGARAVRRDQRVTRATQKRGPLQRIDVERVAGTLLEAKL